MTDKAQMSESSGIAAIKAAAREAAYEARARAHAGSGDAAERVAAHLRSAAAFSAARIVSGYLPIRTELDPRPAMLALLAAGKRLCVPVVEAKGRPLLFRAWEPDVALVEGAFGVRVPAEGDWLEPDLLLVPLLAFDAAGNRLGYGGGFYDRTLAALRARGRALAYGLAYEGQRIADVPREATDASLDAIVTEAGIRDF